MLPKDTLYFHALTIATLLVFAFGLWGNISFWLQGGSKEGGSAWKKLLGLLGSFPGLLFRRATLKGLFLEGILQRRILRESRLRWVMHFSLSWGFVELFFVGSLGNMAADLHLVVLPKDTPWFAVINELGGLLLLLGVALALYRRYVIREPQLKTVEEDWLILLWLLLAAISGFFLEAIRFLSQGVPASLAAYSFVGYLLAEAMAWLGLTWDGAYLYLWWFHALVSLGLVAYLPYSKLFHMFASPVSIFLSSAEGPASSPRRLAGPSIGG